MLYQLATQSNLSGRDEKQVRAINRVSNDVLAKEAGNLGRCNKYFNEPINKENKKIQD